MNNLYSNLNNSNPNYANEGDIHVWEDDHIEWDKSDSILQAAAFQKVLQITY